MLSDACGQRVWELVTFAGSWQFSMAMTVRGKGTF